MGFSSFPDPAQYPSGNTPIYLGYAEVTANQASITAEVDVTGLSVTANVGAGRRIRITGTCYMSNTGTAGTNVFKIYQDGVQVQERGLVPGAVGSAEAITVIAVLTPSAGFHTWKLRAQATAGTGTFVAGANYPAFILVEDITSVATPVAATSVPVGLIAQALSTTSINGISTVTTLLSTNVVVAAGRTLKITAGANVICPTPGQRFLGQILLDGTAVGRWIDRTQNPTASGYNSGSDCTIVSPTAGAHTITMDIAALTSTVNLEASSTEPIHLIVEDITPTPVLAGSAPSNTLAYAEVLTVQSGITTVVDITGLAATVTVAAGRRIKVTASLLLSSTIAGDRIRASIKEGATVLELLDATAPVANATETVQRSVILTPSAGTHTYKVTLERMTGFATGLISNYGDPTFPTFLLVEDITPASVYPVPTTNGISIVSSTTRPGTSVEGLTIYEADTDLIRTWDGGNWKVDDQLRLTGVSAAVIGSIPSTANLPYTGFKIQSGTFVASTDGSGDVTLTYPVPFPNGLITVMCCMGDITVTQANPQVHTYTTSLVGVRVYNSTTGAAILSSGAMRFNWIAIGW